jgi:hypothetical protein
MVAYVVILAEYAAEIAACEEYRAGAAPAYKDTFFAEVWANGTNDW